MHDLIIIGMDETLDTKTLISAINEVPGATLRQARWAQDNEANLGVNLGGPKHVFSSRGKISDHKQ